MPENPKYTPKIDYSLYDPSIEIKNTNNPLANLTSTDYYGDAADFGASKYDDANMSNLNLQTGDYKYLRGEKQSGLAQVGLGVLRAASKAGVEALKTPGYLYSLGEWGVRNAAGEDYTLDKALDNTYINSLENADDYIKDELLPVYKSYQAEKGSFMEQVLTTSFIGTEVADGVGYLLGMTVGPGLAVQGLGTAAKIARLVQATKIAKLSSKAAKIGEGVELGAMTLLNSSVEALAEAKGVSDRFTREMDAMLTPGSPTYNPINPATGQSWTKEEIAKAKADATLETFNANMGVLILPNLIMNKALLGRFGKDKSILDRFRGPDGKLVSDPITKKIMAKEIGKGIAVGIGSEGFLEEGGQTSIENYEINKALGKVPDEFIEGVAKEYLNTLTTTEGKKSILLGALLGGMGSGMGAYRKEKAERARIPAISKMIKENFTTIGMDSDIFERDENGVIKKDENGKSIYNQVAVVKATEAFVKESSDAQLKDKALLYDDELLYNYITHSQVTRFMAPFLKEGEIGLEILNEHIDNVSDTRLANDAKTMAESKQDVFNENKHKAELKQKAKKLQTVYESTQEVLSDMPVLQELAKDPANSEYLSKFVNDVASAIFQETAKQIFFNNEISKAELERTTNIADMISNDLPLANFLNEKLLDKVGTLNKLVAESKKKYEDALNPEEHRKAFDEYKKEVDNVKKLVELLEKEQTKATTTPASETVTTPTPTKTEMDVTAEHDKIIQAKGTLYMVSNLKDFDSVYNTIKDHPLLTDTDKAEFAQKRQALVDEFGETEVVTSTTPPVVSSDQDMVSNSLSYNTVATTDEIKQITPNEIKEAEHDKGINTKINTVMMRLFDHTFVKGIFKWLRNEDGFPAIHNESNISIPELNKLRIGDKVTLKLVPIGLDALTRYQTAKKEAFLKGAKEDVKEADFNDAHIGIYSNGNLIGFVQQPYAIAENPVNKTIALNLRQELIAYRKEVTRKLKAGEEVIEEVTEKGNGNLYTKLNKNGIIDAKFKVFEQARPEDKVNGGLLFGYSDGEKVVFKDSTLSEREEAEVKAQVSDLKYTNKGQVFQLVKDLNGKWGAIPVYASLMNKETVDAIIDVLTTKLTNSTDPMVAVAELNDYIYASTTKENASIQVNFKHGNLIFTVDGTPYSLEQLRVTGPKQNEFKKALFNEVNGTGKRQNISILKINDPNFQKTLEARNTLVTNVTTTLEGEYYIQPYVEISHNVALSEPLNKTTINNKAAKEEALRDVESTAKALEEPIGENEVNLYPNVARVNALLDSYILGEKLFEELAYIGKEYNKRIDEGVDYESSRAIYDKEYASKISEAYHKAKADGSNPELVKAVESLLSKERPASTQSDIEKRTKEELFPIDSLHKGKESGDTLKVIGYTKDGVRFQIQTEGALKPTRNVNLSELKRLIKEGKLFSDVYAELTALENTTTASDEKIDDKIAEIAAKARKKGLGGALNNNDALSTTKDLTKLDRKAFAKWLAKNLPQLTLSDIDKLTDLKTNITDAFGLFKDLTIYLFDGAGNKTAYHEAFHGVFRNMLSQEQRDALITEAIGRYTAPTEGELFQLQDALKKEYTTEELTYLYYEEKLADEFGEFTNRYNDKNWLQKLGTAIADFFNKILSYFNIFTRNPESEINSLFNSINKGKFSNKVINKRELSSFNTEYAASRNLTKVFGPTQKMNIITSISDEFLAQYQESSLKGNPKKASEIYKDIFKKYTDFVNEYNEDLKEHSEKDANIAFHIIDNNNSKDFINESIKLLSIRGIKVSLETGKIDFTGQIEEVDENSDDNVQEAKSKETKGLREATTIDGLSSASNRIKLFLSSIPVLNSDKTVKTDIYGIPQYYDFNALYYFIERNLTGYYTFEDQIQALKELSDNKPQILQVIDLLTNNASNLNKEQFTLLVNDFKTNFSKQQLAYTLVKFDTDSTTGAARYEIMDANRKSIGLQTQTEWNDNLVNPNNNTITEFKDGEPIVTNTAKAKTLFERWTALTARTTPIEYKVASEILSKVGINYTPSVLQNLLDRKDNVFKDNVTALLKYHASEDSDANSKMGREAMKSLVSFETTARFDKFTSSFISADNKNIYTIQLPSFASKLLAKLTSRNYTRSMDTIAELQKDPFNANSNLLNELKNNIQFRNNGFRMTYLDGLKDQKGESKGSKFTSMTPKDFLAMEIALFQNLAINGQKIVTDKVSKYVYITPSDKSMSMIFDAKQYEVSLSTDDKIGLDSPILNNYYNVYLQEVARIKHNLAIKNDILTNKENSKYKLSDLLEHYHARNEGKRDSNGKIIKEFQKWDILQGLSNKQLAGQELSEQDWNEVSKVFNGQSYKFNYFSEKFHNDNIENLEATKESIVASLRDEVTKEFHSVREEMREKGLIANNKGVWTNIALELPKGTNINQLIASYASNAMLANIDISNLLNGDIALYKPNDLQKRTYQSQAMYTNNKFEQKVIKTIVKKDVKAESSVYKNLVDTLTAQGFTEEEIDTIAGAYKSNINVTDAQVFITPAFYKAIHRSRGTWTPIIEEAFDIAEGKKVGKLTAEHRRALAGFKPYYNGNRYDTTLGIQRYEQVKCAILPLFKMYTDINPLLAKNRAEMESSGAEMLAFESAFKGAIGYRPEITDSKNIILELDADHFGIQVDNPDHMDDGNDSMRQLKMLILGSIDSSKEYRGTNGKVIKDRILQMEATNIRKSLQQLQSKMDVKNNAEFANFVKEMVTKRGATINVEEIMTILDGDFEYALDNGNMSSQVENLISSLFTNHVIKQEFAHGGAAVQATSLGLKFRTLTEQQKALTSDELLVQRELEYIKPDLANGVIGYAECAMPASAKEFFNKDGFLKDINTIPDSLKELIAYRIPFEGLHSAMPIRVVKFLPETMGNFILLPYEVTTQLGADFDFDKIYFIGREMYSNMTNNVDTSLKPYIYNDIDSPEALQDRWLQYVNYSRINKEKEMTYEEFKNSSIEDQNTRGARNNEIFDNYMKILTSTENLRWMVTPSGFDALADIKRKYFSTYKKDNFFSSRTQRDFKYRNHIGIALKGQSALHVSGHSYATLMNLSVTSNTILFNGKTYNSLSGLYSDNRKLIADELASIMAAILDDIKNPLLASLNITNNTMDVLATLIRTGINLETAISFISQPSLKELSNLLDVNKNKIKELNQGWFSTKDLVNIYYTKLNSLEVYKAEMEARADAILASGEEAAPAEKEIFNITNEDLDKYLHYEIKPKTGKLVIWEQREGSDRKHYTDATEEEQVAYYRYQIEVLNKFDQVKTVADDLVNINKFFGVNKEVGPNLEDITTKQYVLQDVLNSEIIEGFKISDIPALQAAYETQLSAQTWFSRYFPYNTDAYQSVKETLFKGQSDRSLSKAPVEDRVFVNNFIRYFTDNDINSPFGNVSQSFNEIMLKTPGLLNAIKSFNLKDTKLGNVTYEQIRNNSFIRELKTVYDKENGISYIQLQGNRLNLQVKNNVIEGFKALYTNTSTRDLAIKLIEHSFMTTGFFKGVGNYSNLIGPDVLKELGYNDYRKELISGLKNNSVSLEDKKELLIEQLIRNNPKSFTKVYDASMFEIEDTKALPDIISTSKKLITHANKEKEMYWEIDEVPQNPKYIRVYDKINKKASIYKKISTFTYQYLTPLGKSNFIIEVDTNKPIIKSNLRNNNILLAKERIPVTEVLEGQEEEIPQSYDDQAFNAAEAEHFLSQNPTTEDHEKSMPSVSPFLQGIGNTTPAKPSTNLPGPETKINIYAGTGENADLSNFANRPFYSSIYAKGDFNTVEGAFQAAKIWFSKEYWFDTEGGWNTELKGEGSDLVKKLQEATGAEAKAIGLKIKGLDTKLWDKDSSSVMKQILEESFKQNPDALAKLLATGNATLTHTQDKGKWGKEFPRLLMEVRNELRSTQSNNISKGLPDDTEPCQ